MALGEYLNFTRTLNNFCKKGTLAYSRWKIDRAGSWQMRQVAAISAALFLVFASDLSITLDSDEVHVRFSYRRVLSTAET
jgi:hypothetical protein